MECPVSKVPFAHQVDDPVTQGQQHIRIDARQGSSSYKFNFGTIDPPNARVNSMYGPTSQYTCVTAVLVHGYGVALSVAASLQKVADTTARRRSHLRLPRRTIEVCSSCPRSGCQHPGGCRPRSRPFRRPVRLLVETRPLSRQWCWLARRPRMPLVHPLPALTLLLLEGRARMNFSGPGWRWRLLFLRLAQSSRAQMGCNDVAFQMLPHSRSDDSW